MNQDRGAAETLHGIELAGPVVLARTQGARLVYRRADLLHDGVSGRYRRIVRSGTQSLGERAEVLGGVICGQLDQLVLPVELR